MTTVRYELSCGGGPVSIYWFEEEAKEGLVAAPTQREISDNSDFKVFPSFFLNVSSLVVSQQKAILLSCFRIDLRVR